MTHSFDLIVRGGTVVNHDGIGVRDIGVRGRPDRRDRRPCRGPPPARSIDAAGLHVLPGVIDTQVHFREPGLEHKEDLETGSRAAVLGGVTAVFEMPNTKPLTTIAPRRWPTRCARAQGRMHCDFAFYVGGTHENVDELPDAGAAARLLPASRCSWAPPPATCWSRTTPTLDASSPRSTAAPPSIPRTRPAAGARAPAPPRRSLDRTRCGATRRRR